MIENHLHVIYYPNTKYLLFVKISGTVVKKQKYLLQISVQDLHSDIILPVSEEGFLVQEQLMKNYVLEIYHLGSACQKI